MPRRPLAIYAAHCASDPQSHLGYYASVQKAPYDRSTSSRRDEFGHRPAAREARTILDARARSSTPCTSACCRRPPQSAMFLDKTPAYALVLPFLVEALPGAKYIVLARHPLAVLKLVVWSRSSTALRGGR